MLGTSLAVALSRPLGVTKDDLEGDVLGGSTGDRKLVLLVPGAMVALDGPYLAVLGGAAALRARGRRR